MRRLRIAVVGTGFGARIQVPGLRASGRFDVVALVGRDAARTSEVARRLAIPAAYTSLADALEIPALDAVAIATPPATHAALAVAAARAGKHVLCEKPMARTAGEARAMCEAVRDAGVVGVVDFEFRFHPSRAMAARMVARGDLGTPQLMVATDALALYVAPYKAAPGWWYDADAGGGWLGASGSHLLDAMRAWLGDARRVTAIVDTLGGGTADDTFALLVRLASGARAVLHQSAAVWGPRHQALRISGAEGALWLDADWVLWHVARRGEPTRVAIPADLAVPTVEIPPGAGPFAMRELPCFAAFAGAFADAVMGCDRPPSAPVAATFADGATCQRLIDAAHEASRSNVWVEVEA